MKTAPIAMIQQFIQRWFCDRFAPLLAAFVEGGLSEKQKANVAAHITTCATCRQEVEELTELGNLLRAHPPAVPQLKPDLWSRIQAEIVAESAAQPEHPVAQPIRRQPVPNFQWSSFGLSFATTGTLVAATVVGVVVLTRPLLQMSPTAKHNGPVLAIAPVENPGPITVEIRSPLKPATKPEAARLGMKARVAVPVTVTTAEPRPTRTPRTTLIVATRRHDKHSNRPVSVPVTRTLRSIAPPPAKPYFVAQADKKEHEKTLVVEPDIVTVPEDAPMLAETKSAEKPREVIKVASAIPEPIETELTAEVVAPRTVPAAGFVNDTAKIRARQILFVYSGR